MGSIVKNINDGSRSASAGQTGDAVYHFGVAAGTIAIAFLFPEGLLLWGIEAIIADHIEERIK